jgi:hypothetical protein
MISHEIFWEWTKKWNIIAIFGCLNTVSEKNSPPLSVMLPMEKLLKMLEFPDLSDTDFMKI